MSKICGRNCSVLHCNNRDSNSEGKDISFHKFPLNESILKRWLAVVSSNCTKKPSKWARVCSDHFSKEDYNRKSSGVVRRRLKFDAVPSLKLGDDINNSKISDYDFTGSQFGTGNQLNGFVITGGRISMCINGLNSNMAIKKTVGQDSDQDICLNTDEIIDGNTNKIVALETVAKSSEIAEPEKNNISEYNTKNLTSSGLSEIAELDSGSANNLNIESAENNNIGLRNSRPSQSALSSIELVLQEHDNIAVNVQSTGSQTCMKPTPCDHRFSSNGLSSSQLLSLTGIYQDIFESLSTEVLLLENNSCVTETLIPCKERVFLTLMKLKLSLTYEALASLFRISSRTVSTYFKNTVCAMYEVLKRFVVWPDKNKIVESLPNCFREFQSTRVVLDCFETPMEKPKSLHDRMATYSHYKGTHTLKLMVGISPSGAITVISEPWGGKASDKLITLESKVIYQCEPFLDAIMVDKGFHIEEECSENGISLFRPPFLRKKAQFSRAESLKNQKIACARVHVERTIQRIKLFKILNERFDLDLVPYSNEIVTVVCGLVNLSKPILSDKRFSRNEE